MSKNGLTFDGEESYEEVEERSMDAPILTISVNAHGKIVVKDKRGIVWWERSRYCNPDCLAQAVLFAESNGTIDWNNSTVAKPNR